MSTFVEYVMSYTPGDNPRGDFVVDAKADPSFEKQNLNARSTLKRYLTLKGACADAIKAALDLHKEWERHERRAQLLEHGATLSPALKDRKER